MTFVDFSTPVPADWLNNVNNFVNTAIVWVKSFGAKGDGITDDTYAIQAADLFARNLSPSPGVVYFSPGVYLNSGLTFYTNSNWQGAGRTTVFKLRNGANRDVITGNNSSANWGLPGSSATGFPYNFTLRNFAIDGNKANNTSGSGLTFYGDHCQLEWIFISNCAEHGLRTEFQGDSSIDYSIPFFESSFKSIWIDTVGKHGYWDNGPHDAHHIDMHVLDAGQATANTWDGYFFGPQSAARNVAIHAASRSGSVRMRYAVNLQPGATQEFSGGCNIEGAGVACLGLFSASCLFDSTTRYYASFGSYTIYLGGTNCSLNSIKGWLSNGGSPSPIGIQFSTTTGDSVSNNSIDVQMVGQEGGNIIFTAQDGGMNQIRVKHYNAANVNLFGTPNPTNDIRTQGIVNGGTPFEVNTLDQIYSQTIAGNSTANITWTYPFANVPVIEITPCVPSAALTLPLWVSGQSTVGTSIFNPNTASMTVAVRARALI